MGKEASTTTAYDYTQLVDLFIASWPNVEATGFRWGIGPYFVFPTSNSEFTGGLASGARREIRVSYCSGVEDFGLLQQATSFAYTSRKSAPVTSLTFQPIISYQLGEGWYLKSSDATLTFNLRHNSSTTMPLSAGLGKVWKPASGLSIDTSESGEWTLYRQFADQTEQFSLNFQLTVVPPRLLF